jgi:2-(1,2-epoxy-1,2-dihydrophenyl)acetyl-CoA isomerase
MAGGKFTARQSYPIQGRKMTEADLLLTELKQYVLTLTLNRPKVNAFNIELVLALQAAFKQAEADHQVRCVLLTGSGGVFSAGQDINEFLHTENLSYRRHLQKTYNPLILQIRQLSKPVLAAIQGAVSGAALGIALACDLRIASDDARFVVGFGGIGLAPDSGVSLLLPALIGLSRSLEFTFSNAPISAQQALNWGLVNRVVPASTLGEQAAAWARSLASGPVHAMALAKRDYNRAVLPHLEEVLEYEAHIQEIASKNAEHREGVEAFLEKYPPQFLKASS